MKLANTNRFFLDVQNAPRTYLHLATIFEGVKEYVCFADVKKQIVYIEEATGGHFERIEDDSLAEGIHNFLVDRKVLDMSKPLLPDKEWYNVGKPR